MPRATGPAATAATPETVTPPAGGPEAPAPAAEQPEQPAPEWGFWRYAGDLIRTYTHIPVTVAHGDVIHHPGIPAADGNWQPHDGPATKRPDNWRPDPHQPEPATPADKPAADASVKEG